MAFSINEELRRSFELASLRREANAIQSPRQWAEVIKLQTRCRDLRAKEIDLFHSRSTTRVEQRRKRLIDEAGLREFHFKPRWAIGNDRFDPEATLRQAQRDVRGAHAARIKKIEDYERRKLKDYVVRFGRLNEERGLAREAFGRATERRTGFDRRRNRQRDH